VIFMSDPRLVVDNGWPGDQGDEQSLDLVAGERNEPVRCGVPGLFDGADNGEEGVGEHG
jgi:hypothetical protein